jgi:hypothetical protein
MPLKNLTILQGGPSKQGFQLVGVFTADLDGSYVTNGYPFDPRPYGFSRIFSVQVNEASGYRFDYDATNFKLKVRQGAAEEELIAAITRNRLYIGAVTNGPYVVGETITGGTSGATAVVRVVGSGFLDVDTVVGTFQNAETLTGGTSGATAAESGTLIDLWTPASRMGAVQSVLNNSNAPVTIVSKSATLSTGRARVQTAQGVIETLKSDGYTSLKVTYSVSGGSEVPNATNLAAVKGVVITVRGEG